MFNKQCRTEITISKMVILTNRQPVGNRAPPCREAVQHMQITLGLQHEVQFRFTMAATDAGLFYLYFAHSASSPFKLTSTTAAAAWQSFVDGQGDRTWGKAGTVPTPALCLVNRGVRIVTF